MKVRPSHWRSSDRRDPFSALSYGCSSRVAKKAVVMSFGASRGQPVGHEADLAELGAAFQRPDPAEKWPWSSEQQPLSEKPDAEAQGHLKMRFSYSPGTTSLCHKKGLQGRGLGGRTDCLRKESKGSAPRKRTFSCTRVQACRNLMMLVNAKENFTPLVEANSGIAPTWSYQ